MHDFAFTGKTCLVTGAAGGIGAAIAHELAARGCALALVDRDADGLQQVSQSVRERGAPDVSLHVVDLSDGADRGELVDDVLDRHGRVDLLINNAGVALGGELHQVSLAHFDWLMEINYRAVMTMTKAFLPHLRANPGSHVVNTSSLFGLIAPAGQVPYATSKFAVRGFTEALRHELASSQVGVTVVHPGGIKTNIATNAQISQADVPEAELQKKREQFNTHLTMPPAQAARLIVDAVRRRKPRLVITRPAKVLDLIARLVPGQYGALLGKLMKLRKPRA